MVAPPSPAPTGATTMGLPSRKTRWLGAVLKVPPPAPDDAHRTFAQANVPGSGSAPPYTGFSPCAFAAGGGEVLSMQLALDLLFMRDAPGETAVV